MIHLHARHTITTGAFLCIYIQGVPKLVTQNYVLITQKIENLQYYDICHKMQYMCKFYLQIFTGVQCGFLVSRGRWLLGLGVVER